MSRTGKGNGFNSVRKSTRSIRSIRSGKSSSLDQSSSLQNNQFISVFLQKLKSEDLMIPSIKDGPNVICEGSTTTCTITFTGQLEHVVSAHFKYNYVEDALLNIFSECVSTYSTLRELRIEFCNLSAEQVTVLHDTLQHNSSIVHVSLNGNPNKEQNFYLLLVNTSLRSLTLKYCKINENGARLIARALAEPYQSVSYLSLGSNRIKSEGLMAIAKGMEGNVHLLGLNISDNSIGERGFDALFKILEPFVLDHEAIVLRRRLNYNYFKKMSETATEKSLASALLKSSKMDSKTMKKKRSASDNSRRSVVSIRSNSSFIKISKVDQAFYPIKHPFFTDTVCENGVYTCAGNMTLEHLNIAYNEVSHQIVERLCNIVKYQKACQKESKKIGTGLMRVIIEERNNEKLLPGVMALNTFLNDGFPMTKRMSKSSLKQRPSSAIS